MVSQHNQDGHPPFKGWLPTIQNLTEGNVLQTFNLAHRPNPQNKDQMTTAMDGWLPSRGWSPIIPGMGTCQPQVGHPLFNSTFTNNVAQPPKDGHPQSQAWSPTNTIQNYFNLIKPSDFN